MLAYDGLISLKNIKPSVIAEIALAYMLVKKDQKVCCCTLLTDINVMAIFILFYAVLYLYYYYYSLFLHFIVTCH